MSKPDIDYMNYSLGAMALLKADAVGAVTAAALLALLLPDGRERDLAVAGCAETLLSEPAQGLIATMLGHTFDRPEATLLAELRSDPDMAQVLDYIEGVRTKAQAGIAALRELSTETSLARAHAEVSS